MTGAAGWLVLASGAHLGFQPYATKHGQAEEDDEHLDEERRVADQLHIGPDQGAHGARPGGAGQRAEHGGHQEGAGRGRGVRVRASGRS